MSNKKEIVVIDWIKQNCHEGNFLNLTLSSDQRRVFRGKRKSDCNQELQLQLPREGKLNDGDICLLYTSPSPRDLSTSRMPSSA